MGVRSVLMEDIVFTIGATVWEGSPFRMLSVFPDMTVVFVVETLPEQHFTVATMLVAMLNRGFREGGWSLIYS